MRLIEAEKVKRVMKDYWKAQVDKALTLTFTDGDEANKRINSYLEHNHELLKAIDELPSAEPDTTTQDSIPAETGKNDGDITSSDCISRQAMLDGIDKLIKIHFDRTVVLYKARKVAEDLPSAQPEQTEMIKEIRKWINSGNRGSADYFIVDKIAEIINAYEIN